MSAARERIQPIRTETLPAKTTPEQRYWRGFTNSQLVKEHNAVTHIAFDPNRPYNFAVTSSTRIQVFSSKTRKVVKNFTRFKDTVYSGEFRQDGKLLVAADASGLVQIFDAQHPRSLLVTMQPSTHPTHVTKFHPSITTQLLTCSDDRVARLYDISSTDEPLMSFGEHQDYVRSGIFIPGSNLVATGCYDNVVRLFDCRSGNTSPVLTMNQEAPVEDLLCLSSTTLLSCGETGIKCWDLAAGRCYRTMNNFTKTVTCLYDAGERGILAGSMDGHVKVFDTASEKWDVKFGWKFGSGVLSCGISPNQKHLVVGLNSGLLTIRTRKTEPRVKQGVKLQKSHAFARMIRGADYRGESEYHILDDNVKNNNRKLKQFEKDLNAFKWSDALDHSLLPAVSKELTVTCMEELRKRGKIRVALSGRDTSKLEPLLTWCLKTIDDPRDVYLIADYLACVMDIYSDLIGRQPVLEDIISSIEEKIDLEIQRCKEAHRIMGMLELLSV